MAKIRWFFESLKKSVFGAFVHGIGRRNHEIAVSRFAVTSEGDKFAHLFGANDIGFFIDVRSEIKSIFEFEFGV